MLRRAPPCHQQRVAAAATPFSAADDSDDSDSDLEGFYYSSVSDSDDDDDADLEELLASLPPDVADELRELEQYFSRGAGEGVIRAEMLEMMAARAELRQSEITAAKKAAGNCGGAPFIDASLMSAEEKAAAERIAGNMGFSSGEQMAEELSRIHGDDPGLIHFTYGVLGVRTDRAIETALKGRKGTTQGGKEDGRKKGMAGASGRNNGAQGFPLQAAGSAGMAAPVAAAEGAPLGAGRSSPRLPPSAGVVANHAEMLEWKERNFEAVGTTTTAAAGTAAGAEAVARAATAEAAGSSERGKARASRGGSGPRAAPAEPREPPQLLQRTESRGAGGEPSRLAKAEAVESASWPPQEVEEARGTAARRPQAVAAATTVQTRSYTTSPRRAAVTASTAFAPTAPTMRPGRRTSSSPPHSPRSAATTTERTEGEIAEEVVATTPKTPSRNEIEEAERIAKRKRNIARVREDKAQAAKRKAANVAAHKERMKQQEEAAAAARRARRRGGREDLLISSGERVLRNAAR